jgi:hypothetical protein
MQPVRATVARAILAVVTLVLLISQIGFALVPLLAPAHIWAARRSSIVGRWLWTLVPALGVGALAWAAIYVPAGELKPAIWRVPAVALAVSWIALRQVAGPPPARHAR